MFSKSKKCGRALGSAEVDLALRSLVEEAQLRLQVAAAQSAGDEGDKTWTSIMKSKNYFVCG